MATIDVKDAAGSTVALEKPLTPGRSAAATSRPVALSTEDKAVLDLVATAANQTAQATLVGAVTETAPTTDTASSGLNGRMQRVAQRLSSMIALIPTALGAGGGLKVDGSGTALPVSAASLPLPTGASTEVTLAAHTAKMPATLGQKAMSASMAVAIASDQSAIPVAGGVAHDGVDSGNPNKIGLQARITWPAAVSDADRVNAIGDKYGRTVVAHTPRDLRSRQVTTITSSTAETTIVTAGAAGVLRDIFKLLISNSSATATTVTIKDATAGTTVETYVVPAGQTVGFCLPSCDALKQTTAANNWTATCGTSVASVFITALFVNNSDA